MKTLFTALTLLACTQLALANPPSAVHSDSCQNVKNTKEPFILVLKKGEKLQQSIVKCANQANLNGASLSALGAVDNTTLTNFDHKKKTYDKKVYPNFMELIALSGNINFVNGKRDAHIHVALSDQDYQMVGGHLGEATVAATAEVTIIPMQYPLNKTMDEKTGLNLINTR